MSFTHIYFQFLDDIKKTGALEFIAVFFGILSVIYSRKENILVFPTGLINTILYTYFCFFLWNLKGEASLNLYYTLMSIYGWWLWQKKKNNSNKNEIAISYSNKKEWRIAIIFFTCCWIILYLILKNYTKSNVPFADAFASATAYTAMWLMAKKKIENWLWWVLTNLISIPLYFYKHAVFTSFQYVVFLILAIMGYFTWVKKIKQPHELL